MQLKKSFPFLILISCLASIAVAKSVGLKNNQVSQPRIHRLIGEKPLSVTVVVTPVLGIYPTKNHNEKKVYETNFASFRDAGTSFFSKYDQRKKNNALDLIDFNKVEIKKAVSITFLPLFDYSENLAVNDTEVNKSKTPFLNILLIKFPLF